MKTLYLNRHAKSSWNQPYTSDFERGLNKRGDINARFMAARFAKESAAIPIVSSPATRALATAKHFAKAMGVSKDEIVKDPIIYGASANDMLRLIQNLSDNWDAVILFGHNPTFSELAYLLDHSFTDHLVTCARVKISCDVPSWAHINPNIGLVDYHDYPRKYPEMENL